MPSLCKMVTHIEVGGENSSLEEHMVNCWSEVAVGERRKWTHSLYMLYSSNFKIINVCVLIITTKSTESELVR